MIVRLEKIETGVLAHWDGKTSHYQDVADFTRHIKKQLDEQLRIALSMRRGGAGLSIVVEPDTCR